MVLADTPMGVQPFQPLPPSFTTESVKKEEDAGEQLKEKIGDFGLKTDQYAKQLAAMRAKGAAPGREWTDQETVMLLEALEMFKDDWNKVFYLQCFNYNS